MKSQTILEFKETVIITSNVQLIRTDSNITNPRFSFVWDSPRLSTQFAEKDAKAGGDRAVCRTVNGIIRIHPLDKFPILGFNEVIVGGAYVGLLMGSYGGLNGAIKEQYRIPDPGSGRTPRITGIQPSFGKAEDIVYNSAGAYGSDFFYSYSNLADEIFMRVAITPFSKETLFTFEKVILPIRAEISGVLIAADPG
jgi:hypothetical protein